MEENNVTAGPVETGNSTTPVSAPESSGSGIDSGKGEFYNELSKAVDTHSTFLNQKNEDPGKNPLPSEVFSGQKIEEETKENVEEPESTETPEIFIGKTEDLIKGQPEENPVEVKPEVKQPEAKTFEIDGHILTAEKVHELAKNYHENAKKQYDEYQNFLAEKQQFEQIKNAPESVILKHLKENPDFLAEVMEIAPKFVNNVDGEIQSKKLSETDSKLQERLDRLEKLIQEKEAKEAERIQQYETQQRQATTQKMFEEVDAHSLARAKELGIPNEEVMDLAHAAIARINLPEGNPNKLNVSKDDLIKFFNAGLERKAKYFSAAKASARTDYLREKKSAPVPPASSGSTPKIQPKQFSGFGTEKVNEVENDLLKALGKIR